MILKDKDCTKFIIECDCGCSGIKFSKIEDETEKEYFIYHIITSFYAEQNTAFDKFKRKLKIIWDVLTSGFHFYNQICLTENQFKELKKTIIEFE